MAVAKLRIDLTQGIVEAEGDDSFVKSVYNDFKERILSNIPLTPTPPANKPSNKASPQPIIKSDTGKSSKSKKSSSHASGTIVKDLDLSGSGKVERLKDFYAKYSPSSNFERNLIFLYYLQHKCNLTGITLDHVFTCYRDIGIKVPTALHQSLVDTSAHKGWLDTSSSANIEVTIPGMNYLEHDMKKSDTQ